MLTVGDTVPNIKLASSKGGEVSLTDYKGKKVVLYFYPKDDTPGCTAQACAFRDYKKDYEDLNAVIIGVSKDPLSKHDKFIEKYGLPFELLADEEHKLAEAFGAWDEKSLYGKLFMGMIRSTFLIDEDGKIVKEWRKVKVAGHVEEVLEAARSI